MYNKAEFFTKSKTKFPTELHHVFDKVAHSCPAFSSFGKLAVCLNLLLGPGLPLEFAAFLLQLDKLEVDPARIPVG